MPDDASRIPVFVGVPPHVNGHVFQPPAKHERRPAAPRSRVDYRDVKHLRIEISNSLAAQLTGRTTTDGTRRVLGEETARTAIAKFINARLESGLLSAQEVGTYEGALTAAVLADMFGAGRFQMMLDDTEVENVTVQGYDQVRIEYGDGRIETGDPVADSDDDLVDFLRHIARRGSTERALSSAQPWLNLRLPDGSRLAALYDVTPRPIVVIRRHRTRDVDLDDLTRMNMIDPVLRDFLRAVMKAQLNVMIVGLPGAGKTTLLRAMAAEIPPQEWWATLEQEYELHLHENPRHPWLVPIEAREGFGERGADGRPAGEVAISDLIPLMLRLNMRRFLVGEVRSTEIVPMLETMGTVRGSLCTMHARTPGSVFERIVELALRYGPNMTAELAYHMAASALDYIVYVEIVDETAIGGRTHRFVSHVIEVEGARSGAAPTRVDIFAPGVDGRAAPTGHRPSRTLYELTRSGFDMGLLNHRAGLWRAPLPLRFPR